MPRGRASQVGDTYTSANGYHYTKTDNGFRLTHHLVLEKRLGRPIDTSKEQVYFVDGDKTNLDPDNIGVREKNVRVKKRIAEIDARIAELEAEKERLQKECDS